MLDCIARQAYIELLLGIQVFDMIICICILTNYIVKLSKFVGNEGGRTLDPSML